jgi:hypothetical protein
MKKSGEKAKREKGEEENPRNIITAQTVRAALTKLGGVGSAAVAEHFQVKSYGEREKIQKVLGEMLHNRQVISITHLGQTIYRLCGQPVGRGAVQAKLWEFACLRFAAGKPFTCSEAARMAECGLDYAKRYYRWLWGAGFLAIVKRGRAGALLYQVVGGKEHEAAPAWNRRAEKRKHVGQAPPPAVSPTPPATPSPQPSPAGGEEDKDHRLVACAGKSAAIRLDAALEEFGRALVEVAGGIVRAWEIIREMKGELLAMEEQCHDEPGEPTEGHH